MRGILLFFIFIGLFFNSKSQGIGAGCPEVIDQQITAFNLGTAGQDQWQSFTPALNGRLTKIDVKTNGCSSYSLQLTVYAGTGTVGAQLYTGTYTNTGICNNWLACVIPFSIAPNVNSGNNYTFRIQSANQPYFLVDSSNVYAGGTYYSSDYGLVPKYDLNFRTWVQSVNIPSVSITAMGPQITCPGGSVTLNASNGPFSYLWYNPGGPIPGSNFNSFPAITGFAYAVVVTNTLTNCYNTSNSLAIVGSPQPITTATVNHCRGKATILTSLAAGTYTWNTGANTSSISISPQTNTQYTVNANNTSGCLSTSITNVVVIPSPILNINAQTATVNLGNCSSILSGWGTNYFYFTDPLPPNSRITGYTFNYDAVDQAWGGTGCFLNTEISGEPLAGANITNAIQNYSYYVPTSAPSYTYGGQNSLGLSFCGWGGWQAFTYNTKVIIHYDRTLQSVCSGNTISLLASGAASYTWSGGISNGVPFQPAGTSVYTISASMNNGCTSTRQVTVAITAPPTLSVTGPGSVCAGNALILSASGANTYTWSGGISGPTNTFVPLGITPYTVQGTSTLSGCTASLTNSVAIYAPPTITVTAQPSVCAGSAHLLTASGANTYTWSGGGFGNTKTLFPMSNTAYTVQGTSTLSGCTGSVTNTVSVTPLPVLSITGPTSVCAGSLLTLTVSGANSYSWAGGGSGPINTFLLFGSAPYTVQGTSTVTGCIGTYTNTLIAYTLPSLTVTGPSTVCAGNPLTLTVSGASTYSWAGGGSGPTNTFLLFGSAPYTVQGTSAMTGCTGTYTNTLTAYTAPVLTVTGPSSVCAGSSLMLSVSGADTYTWSGGGSGPTNTLFPVSSTPYTVQGTSTVTGCTASLTNSVVSIPLPTITVSNYTMCMGDVVNIAAGGVLTSTVLNANAMISPSVTSSYSVIGTSSAGCISSNIAISTVSVFSLPLVSVTGGTLCEGQTFTLIPSGAASYLFLNGGPLVSPSVTASYTVVGTSSLGCVSQPTAVANITVFSTPIISVLSGSICSGQIFTLQIAGALTYTFSSGSSTVSPQSTTIYSVSGTNANGCVSAQSSTCEVIVDATPTISVPGGTICAGESFVFTHSGAVNYTYTGGSSMVSPSVTTVYQISGYSSNGCESAPATTTIIVNQLPQIIAAFVPATPCIGDTITPMATGALTLTWSGGLVNGIPINPPSGPQNYSVKGVDINGCRDSSSTTLIVYPLPTVSIASSQLLSCETTSVQLTANGAQSYTWLSGATGSAAIVFPTTTQTFSVIGKDKFGCRNSASYTQSVIACPKEFIAYAQITDVSCRRKNNGKINVIASADYDQKLITYKWSNEFCPLDTCTLIENLAAGIYKIKVLLTYTLNNTLVKRDSILLGPLAIADVNDPCDIKTYNGISSNSENDHFFINNIEVYPKNKVTIFNRWGLIVKEITGYDNKELSWPSASELENLQASTYFYIIDLGDGSTPLRGWIEIVKP